MRFPLMPHNYPNKTESSKENFQYGLQNFQELR